MEVEIRGYRTHHERTGTKTLGIIIALVMHVRSRMVRWLLVHECILQMDDDFIARAHAEVGRFPALGIGIAVASRAVGLPGVPGG